VRLPFLFYAHTAIVPRHKHNIAVLTYTAFERRWQADFRSHGYFPGSCYVMAGQLRIRFARFFSLLEESLYPLFGYLLCG
jgi:hypothetical protein